jgi:hypothetical protein
VSAETLKVVFRRQGFATTEKFYGARRKVQSAGEELRRLLAPECKKPGLMGGIDQAVSLSPTELKKLKAILGAL